MSDHQSHIQQHLKSADPERYLSCLYLPENIRHSAMTLYAFDVEISRIPNLISEPMPGEIRIQWWRDLIKSGGNVGSSPSAEALMEVVKDKTLPREILDNYLQARIFDLYQDPMPDVGTYEGYLGETVSSILNLIAISGGAEQTTELADACGHTGVAVGISQHLSSCAQLRARGQVYFPLSILAKQDFDRNSWIAPEVTDRHQDVVVEVLELAREHLQKAKNAISLLPKENRSIFLPVVFASKILDKISRNPSICLHKPVVLSPLSRQWVAFRGASKL